MIITVSRVYLHIVAVLGCISIKFSGGFSNMQHEKHKISHRSLHLLKKKLKMDKLNCL